MAHIVIVGAGISGLALAGFLERQERDYTVLERATEFGRVGYGIGLWRNGIRMLEELGVADRVMARANSTAQFQIRRADESLLREYALPGGGQGTGFAAVHRADLHQAVRSGVPDERIVMGAAPTKLERDGKRVVIGWEGGRIAADAVIGADGVDSWVRTTVFGTGSVSADTEVWSFWAAESVRFPDATTSVWGRGMEVFTATVNGRGLVNVAVTGRNCERDPYEALSGIVAEIGWVLPEALQSVDREDLFHDEVKRVTLDTWVRDRVALIGDAAHAMHPITGMGASLALEDAFVLAEELKTRTVPDALNEYERRRLERVAAVRREERLLMKFVLSDSRLLHRLMDFVVAHLPVEKYYSRRLERLVRQRL